MNRRTPQRREPDEVRSIELPLDRSIAAIAPLSRSFQGESNTDVSAQKEAFLLTGVDIAVQVQQNFRRVVRALATIGPAELRTAQEAEVLLHDTYRVINLKLHPETRPFFRTWDTPFPEHAKAIEVPAAYSRFCSKFVEEWAFSSRDPVGFAAWMEWSSNARGHFWYDGCGRIARSVSVAKLVRSGLVYPAFENRSEYFSLIAEPLEIWTANYRARTTKSA